VTELNAMISKIEYIIGVNMTLWNDLKQRVAEWSHTQCVGDIFIKMVRARGSKNDRYRELIFISCVGTIFEDVRTIHKQLRERQQASRAIRERQRQPLEADSGNSLSCLTICLSLRNSEMSYRTPRRSDFRILFNHADTTYPAIQPLA
jgi:gamma-glutamylcysteine synthetase